MPRTLAALLLAASVILLAPVARPAGAAGQIVEVDVPAPALEGNLLKTPAVQGAAVYLPPGYEDAPERRYPTIYLLHGIFDS